jgi:hypothetical protein
MDAPDRQLVGVANQGVDLAGRRFGRLFVVGIAERRRGFIYWLCRCDCGGQTSVRTGGLTRGKTVSCGCRAREARAQASLRHGKRGSRTYTAWVNMLARCTNQNRIEWPHYGGRGITVCDRWRDSFESFLADMGDAPEGLTLDRIDNDGNYEPGNCRWASRTVQMRNTRANRLLTFNGRTATMREWADVLGLKYSTLHKRLYHMSFADIVNTIDGKNCVLPS